MACGDIRYHFRNEKRAETRAFVFCKIITTYLFFKCFYSSNTRRKNNPNPIRIFLFKIQSRIFYRFFGSFNGQLRITIVFSHFFSFEKLTRIEAFHFAGKLGFE